MSYATDLISDLLDRGYGVEFKKVDAAIYRVEVAHSSASLLTRLTSAEDRYCLYALEAVHSRVGALEEEKPKP